MTSTKHSVEIEPVTGMVSAADRWVMLESAPMTGDDVLTLQEIFRLLGYRHVDAVVDGVFGPQTEMALRQFQRDYGLAADGVCGPVTMRALRSVTRSVRHRQIRAGRQEPNVEQVEPSPPPTQVT